jgi:hypothetical protein
VTIWGRGGFETKVGTTLPMFGVEGYNILIRRVMNNGKIVESGPRGNDIFVPRDEIFRVPRSAERKGHDPGGEKRGEI